ncbi:MAG: ABC transporter ATP-binding protein [Chloroflexi bacterium]|nr:ABC transporter ATP-binding protein [Chloroflexota bacterium]
MKQLQVTNLDKSFPGQPVLHHLGLDVEAGSTTAILGASGCGKTTLLRLIAGFDRPDGGEIRLEHRLVAGPGAYVPPEKRRVGYVPQEGALFPHLNVTDNVAFGLPRTERRARRVQEMLELVGMPRLGDRKPHELSGGQQQRVALARALAPAPSLVLLDEPFSGLDTGLRGSLRADVKRALSEFGATTLLVTHDQAEAFFMADEVAVMRGGCLVQRSDPATLYWEPADPAVARFVGEANLLEAEIDSTWAECVLGHLPLRNPDSIGDGPALVLIRPEQIVCLGSAHPGVQARVVETRFFGQAALVLLQLDHAPQPVQVTGLTPGYAVPEAGSMVAVRVEGAVTALPFK